MAALWKRDKGGAQSIDIALTESVFSMMEGMLPEYGRLGKIKQPAGARIATAAPSNAYPTRDGTWVLIAANSDPLFAALCRLIGSDHLQADSRFCDNPSRVANVEELDRIISEWTSGYNAAELTAILAEAEIPVTKVYTVEDIAEDPQFRARGMVVEAHDPLLGQILHSGVVPHFPDCPGEIRWTGPSIGQHTDEILKDLLGLADGEITGLRSSGVVA